MAKIHCTVTRANKKLTKPLEAIGQRAEAATIPPPPPPKPGSCSKQPIKANFRHLYTQINKVYQSGRKAISFRSCLLNNNSDKNSTMHYIETEPKWLTILQCSLVDPDTGELVGHENIETNNHKASNGRKIKALDKWCGVFNPLYQQRKVSLFFYTFTQADQAALTIAQVIEVLKKRFKRKGYPIHGYVWTLEVSRKGHIHYHMAIATDRMKLKGAKLPTWLKASSVWQRRTQVEFVRKNIRHYMAKYFAKNNTRITDKRSYGMTISKPFKQANFALNNAN